MTDTQTSSYLDYEPVEIATAEVILATGSDACSLAAQVMDWPEESPSFPAVTHVVVNVGLDLLQLSPQGALALAPRFAEFAQLLTKLAEDTITRVVGKLPTTTSSGSSTFTDTPPTWAISSTGGRSGANGRFAWCSHEGAPATITVPVVAGMDDSGKTIVSARLFEFTEETEATVTYLRVVAGDIDVDLLPAEVDILIADTESWLTSVRAMRAAMVGTEAGRGGAL